MTRQGDGNAKGDGDGEGEVHGRGLTGRQAPGPAERPSAAKSSARPDLCTAARINRVSPSPSPSPSAKRRIAVCVALLLVATTVVAQQFRGFREPVHTGLPPQHNGGFMFCRLEYLSNR